jgi:hypothetical protein
MAKCIDHLCKLRAGCARYLKKGPDIESFFVNSPRKGDACTAFSDAHDWPDAALHTLKRADELAVQQQAMVRDDCKPYYKGD